MICPICKQKKVTNLQNVSGYNFCHSCHTAWPKRSQKTSYEEEYFNPKSSIASWLVVPVFNLFYEVRKRYIDGGKEKLWIDVGAGRGEFLEKVNAGRRIGVEISKVGIKEMEKKGLETLTSQKFLKAAQLNADIISFWHVLEHVGQPGQFLSTASRNLNKGGKIVIGVPNVGSLEFKLFKRHWFHLVPKYHLWHFSPNSIERLLKDSGFKIERVDFWSIEHHLTGVLQSFINKTANSNNVLHRLVKRGTGLKKMNLKDVSATLFWLTLGFPLVLAFFALGAVIKKPGTFVVVASKKSQ